MIVIATSSRAAPATIASAGYHPSWIITLVVVIILVGFGILRSRR
jgi:hypothetical protein